MWRPAQPAGRLCVEMAVMAQVRRRSWLATGAIIRVASAPSASLAHSEPSLPALAWMQEKTDEKHLVAFLSMIGLAGSAGPARAQVLKGADENSKAKTESQIKATKQNATNAQIQNNRKDKWKKANTENNAAKNQARIKGEKTAAENKAAKSQLQLKQQTLKNQNTSNGQKDGLTKAALTKAKQAPQQ